MNSLSLPLEKIQSDQLASVSSRFLRLRPRLLAPAGPALLLLLYSAGIPRAQFFALALNFLGMLGFFFWESWKLSSRSIEPEGFARSLMVTVAGLALACALSGGPSSPFLPILFAPVGIALAAFGTGRLTRRFLVLLALGLCGIALGGWLVHWPPIAAPQAQILLLLGTLLSTTLLYFGITALASAYRGTASRLESIRLDIVSEASRRTLELEAVGARVAHEIKNPLASIKGLVQLVHDTADSQEVRLRERLAVVLGEISRVEKVLRDYLSFSRPLGELKPSRQRLDQFLREFVELVSGQARKNGVELRLSCPAIEAEFDADKLKQALLNLAQNALFAMPGGGRLELSARTTEVGLELSVNDNGRGMSSSELSRIKEPFFSLSEGGTGLGVVIANGIVSQHGGELSFESQPGIGTTAHIRLPLMGSA